MLRGKVYLDRIYLNFHKQSHSFVNGSLNAIYVEDALAVGELFDRLRCATRVFALRLGSAATGQNPIDEIGKRRFRLTLRITPIDEIG